MAYYTGSISTPADMKSLIDAQAVTNGWTKTGEVLHKGLSAVKLTAASSNRLSIDAYNDPDGITGASADTRSIYLADAYKPATYHLFIHSDPDIIVFVIVYNVNNIQMMMFGDIKKIHSSAYVGGNFYFATLTSSMTELDQSYVRLDNENTIVSGGHSVFRSYTAIAPFAENPGGSYPTVNNKQIRVEIDGETWVTQGKVLYTSTTIISLYRSPNTWNSQTHLVPMNLQFAGKDNLWHYLGFLEHIRLVRIDNYEIGDIITIAPDSWKVFPWSRKNSVTRNGGTDAESGTIGFAVRYDA
jgi:hypothetical protein